MEIENFYKIYIPALEKALQNDSINEGFYVKSPEDYVDRKLVDQIIQYLEDHEDEFLEKAAYYFDAKSHNFPSVQGVDIDAYKANLIQEIVNLKIKY